MKAITIWQPWASLIACGAKRYETRSWPTKYRGPIAIHAAAVKVPQVLRKLFPTGEWSYTSDYAAKSRFLDIVAKGLGGVYTTEELVETLNNLPTGSVVATAELVNVWHIVWNPGPDVDAAKKIPIGAESLTLDKHAHDFGDYFVPSEMELAFGDWTPGRYAWELANVKPITPVPVKGKQGLWQWEAPV